MCRKSTTKAGRSGACRSSITRRWPRRKSRDQDRGPLPKRSAGYEPAEDVRYNQRSSAERVNSNLKDNCGGNHVRVRGAAKVFCHLMLGVVVITVEQLMRLVS